MCERIEWSFTIKLFTWLMRCSFVLRAPKIRWRLNFYTFRSLSTSRSNPLSLSLLLAPTYSYQDSFSLLPRLFLSLTKTLPHSYQNYHQDYFDHVTGKVLRESSDNLQLGIAINNINPNAYRREISKHTIVSI